VEGWKVTNEVMAKRISWVVNPVEGTITKP
jgi:hypothetical protein